MCKGSTLAVLDVSTFVFLTGAWQEIEKFKKDIMRVVLKHPVHPIKVCQCFSNYSTVRAPYLL